MLLRPEQSLNASDLILEILSPSKDDGITKSVSEPV